MPCSRGSGGPGGSAKCAPEQGKRGHCGQVRQKGKTGRNAGTGKGWERSLIGVEDHPKGAAI